MSITTASQIMTWRQASALAYKIECQLRPGCDRIEVVGSVRRRASHVGDVDLLIVPKREAGLFGAAQPGESLLEVEIHRLLNDKRLILGRCNGQRRKHFFTRSGYGVELWISDPDQWGVLMAVRTGPASFTRGLVTEEHRGGLLRDGFAVHDWKVWQRIEDPEHRSLCIFDGETFDATPICFEEERSFLETMAGGWIDPEVRP
jgi:DNA polymerase/3'-5' exonuclease PolX